MAASVQHAGELPEGAIHPSAVWTGESIFVVGGRDLSGDIRYTLTKISPATGAVELLSSEVPGPVNNDFAFWDPRPNDDGTCTQGCAYVLGIWVPSGGAKTLRYDPVTATFDFLDAQHPNGAHAANGVWTGEVAYLFGGVDTDLIDHYEIYRYDPRSDSYTHMNATLPRDREDPAVVWAEGNAYILGGYGCAEGGVWRVCDEVLRYDPSTDTIARVGTLPLGMAISEATWDGDMILLTGGVSWGNDRMDRVVRYDPRTGEAITLAPRLPHRLADHAAVWTGDALYMIGGASDTGLLADITRYTLEPAAPPRVDVQPLSSGSALVTWQPPASNTYSALTGYRVYKASPEGSLLASVGVAEANWELIGETSGTTTSFLDPGHDALSAQVYRVSAINAGRDEGPGTSSGNALLIGALP